ncbi:Dabb family protein [Paenibacillus sambharensis]|uniref:Dabb family protein n=1 Tax=Paenibacillus sambharensis TaxID=1803190 RepID=A0A2W1M1K9_9BACL|nr:Dabb family protein [Paenibacillus sambharensis]PZD97537.1 Dabb family protein [Paenibacillus sambharensis]
MIQRTVLIKFAETTPREQLLEVVDRFKTLQHKIEGIVEIQAGLNKSEKSKEYQVVLMVRFENQQAVDAYTVHAEHQAVVAFIGEAGRLDSIGADIDI